MGNTLAVQTSSLEQYLQELPGHRYEKSLGRSKFLKTLKCAHDEGPVVVKVYIKPTTATLVTGAGASSSLVAAAAAAAAAAHVRALSASPQASAPSILPSLLQSAVGSPPPGGHAASAKDPSAARSQHSDADQPRTDEKNLAASLQEQHDPSTAAASSSAGVAPLTDSRALTLELDRQAAIMSRIRTSFDQRRPSSRNVWPYQQFVQTDKAAFLVRQFFADSLYDRLGMRPFLAPIERRWIAYQLLRGLAEAHADGVCHGDLCLENCMVTAWHWVYIVDWASFKPVRVPEDDPAVFSFFFDVAARRRCYLAPERFAPSATIDEAAAAATAAAAAAKQSFDGSHKGSQDADAGGASLSSTGPTRSPRTGGASSANVAIPQELGAPSRRRAELGISFEGIGSSSSSSIGSGNNDPDLDFMGAGSPTGRAAAFAQVAAAAAAADVLTPAMDVFGLGCVIAELWLDGTPLFTLSDMLAYRRGEYSPEPLLLRIEASDPAIARLVRSMIQLDPERRLGALAYLQSADGQAAFPAEFADYHRRLSVVGELEPDERIDYLRRHFKDFVGERHHQTPAASSQPSQTRAQTTPHPSVTPARHSKPPQLTDQQRFEEQFGRLGPRELLRETESLLAELTNDVDDGAGPSSIGGDDAASDDNESRTGAPRVSGDQLCLVDLHNNAVCNSSTMSGRPAVAEGGGHHRATDPACLPHLLVPLAMLTSWIRHCKFAQSRARAMLLLPEFGRHLDDSVKLDRVLPHLVTALSDSASGLVRMTALRCVTKLLDSVRRWPHEEVDVMPAYVFPALAQLVDAEKEEAVLIVLLECLPVLADCARRGLESCRLDEQLDAARLAVMGTHPAGVAVALTEPGDVEELGGDVGRTGQASVTAATVANKLASVSSESIGSVEGRPTTTATTTTTNTTNFLALAKGAAAATARAQPTFDAELSSLQETVYDLLVDVLSAYPSSPFLRRAALRRVTLLCRFFGQQRACSLIVPLIISFLNDQDWRLRAAFFDVIVGVGAFIGPAPFEAYLFECTVQKLWDAEEWVVEAVLRALTGLLDRGLIRLRPLLTLLESVPPMLLHPNRWLRHGATAVLAAAARSMGPVDAFCQLLPRLHPFLRAALSVHSLSQRDIADALVEPLTRAQFYRAIQDVMTRSKSSEQRSQSLAVEQIVDEFEAVAVAPGADDQRQQQQQQSTTGDSSPNDRERNLSTIFGAAEDNPSSGTSKSAPNHHPATPGNTTTRSSNSAFSDPSVLFESPSSALSKASSHHPNRPVSRNSSPSSSSGLPATQSAAVSAVDLSLGQKLHLIGPFVDRAAPFLWQAQGGASSSHADHVNLTAGGNYGRDAQAALDAEQFDNLAQTCRVRRIYLADFLSEPGGRATLNQLNKWSRFTAPPAADSQTPAASAGGGGAATGNLSAVQGASDGGGQKSGGDGVASTGDSGAAGAGRSNSASSSRTTTLTMSQLPGLVVVGADGSVPELADHLVLSDFVEMFVDRNDLPLFVYPEFDCGAAGHKEDRGYEELLSTNNDGTGNDEEERNSLSSPRALLGGSRLLRRSAVIDRSSSLAAGNLESRARAASGQPQLRRNTRTATFYGVDNAPTTSDSVGTDDSSSQTTAVDGSTSGFGVGQPVILPVAAEASDPQAPVTPMAASSGGVGGVRLIASDWPSQLARVPLAPRSLGQLVRPPRSGESFANGWRPKGVMVAHLHEHKGPVTQLRCSADNLFFASAGADGSVRIWDCQRLERNVASHSKLAYTGQGGRITSLAVCGNSHTVASGSDNGSIHVWRVDAVSRRDAVKYRGVTDVTKIGGSSGGGGRPGAVSSAASAATGPVTCLAAMDSVDATVLLYATAGVGGRLQAHDLRSGRAAFALRCRPALGPVTAFVVDPAQNWVFTGTARGCFTLWDLRFHLPLLSWQHPDEHAVRRLALYDPSLGRGAGGGRPSLSRSSSSYSLGAAAPSPASPSGTWVLSASGASHNEVEVWDVAHATCVQLLRTAPADGAADGSGARQPRPQRLSRGPHAALHASTHIDDILLSDGYLQSLTRTTSGGATAGGTHPSAHGTPIDRSAERTARRIRLASSSKALSEARAVAASALGGPGAAAASSSSSSSSGGGGGNITDNAIPMGPPASVTSTVRALCRLPRSSLVFTGGDDCAVRSWDLENPLRTFVLGETVLDGPETFGTMSLEQKLEKRARCSALRTDSGFSVLQLKDSTMGRSFADGGVPSSPATASSQTGVTRRLEPPLSNHVDSITDLCAVELPSPMLISGSRDGVIKVWT